MPILGVITLAIKNKIPKIIIVKNAPIENYKNIFSKDYITMGSFYKSYSSGKDLHIPHSHLGVPTSPMVAKQLEEFGKLLNQGMKNIEIGTIDPTKFEQIPKQHFEEVRRLAHLTDSHPSVHAPLIDLSGFPTQEGERAWKEEQREAAERQVFSILERSQTMSNGENVPVVFHAGRITSQELGVPWDPKSGPEGPGLKKVVFDKKTGEQKIEPSPYRSITVVNQDTGELAPLSYEEKYIIGKKEPDIWDPFKRLKSLNNSQWDDEKLKLLAYQKEIEELKEKMEIKQKQNEAIDKTGLKSDNNYKALHEANERDITLLSRHAGEINRKLASDYENVYDKFKRFASDENKKKFEKRLEEINKDYGENHKVMEKIEQEARKLEEQMRKAKNEEDKKSLAEKHNELQNAMFKINLEQTKNVITNLADLPTPKVWVPVNELAIDKTTDTISNSLAKLYKKLKDEGKDGEKKMPFIAMENFFVNTPMSTGEELRKAVIEGRKKLTEKLQKDCKLSEKDAAKEAEKLIGATWDVGHINNLRKAGYEGEELKKEVLKNTKDIADVVKHVHITDNFGFFDSHLPPGMGNVPIKEIMEHLEKTWAQLEKEGKLHQQPRGIVEAGGFVAEIGQNPTLGILEYFGSPFYKISPSPYFWGPSPQGAAHTYAPYHESFIEFPQQHFSLYGSSFTTLPKAVGGQVGEDKTRFSGTPNQ